MANLKKTFELAFAIGGKLDPSFKTANSEAAAQLAQLSKKSQEAMTFNKLQKEHSAALNNFNKAAAGMGAAWGNVAQAIIGPIKQIAVVGGAVGAAIYGLAAKTASMGDNAVKTASKLGLTTKEYSALAYAANQSGLSVESFNSQMGRMNTIVNQAARSGKNQLYIEGKRVMSIRDETGAVKSRNRILLEASDAYSKLSNETQQLEFVTQLFGKQGREMIPMLEAGSAEILRLKSRADELGVTWDDLSGKNAVEFSNSLTDVKASIQGLIMTVGQQLHVPLTKVNYAFVEWIKNNRILIGQKVTKAIEEFKNHLPQVKQFLFAAKDAVVQFAISANNAAKSVGGWPNVLKGVAVAFVAIKAIGIVGALMGAVVATIKFIAAAKTLITTTIALAKASAFMIPVFKGIAVAVAGISAPVAVVIAAIASIGVATYMVIKHWDDVVYFFANMRQTVPIFISDLVDDIKGFFSGLPNWLQNIINPIKDIILGPIEAVQVALQGDIKGFFAHMGKFFLSKLKALPIMFANAGNEVIKAITGIDLISTGKEWIQRFIDGILNTLGSAGSVVKDAVKGLIPEGIRNIGGSAVKAVSGLLPKFGNGGIATSPSIVAEDGRPEAVIPLTKPKRAMEIIQNIAPMLQPSSDNLRQAMAVTNNNTKNVGGGTLNFSPTINITGGVDSSNADSTAKTIVSHLKSDFERMFNDMMYQRQRVAMS